MKKIRYKGQNKQNYKKILVVLFVMTFILICISLFLSKLQKNAETIELSYDNIKTVKQVVEYYKARYISESESQEEGFSLNVFLKFNILPYDENDNSNEKYYNDFIEDLAKVVKYNSFKMIDNENDITIKVICENRKIASIIINDIENYFTYMDSQISMKKYVEIERTDFKISSKVLQDCINNNWNDIDLGTRDSIFEGYYIYFNQGIKVRTIANKVYNIVFDKNYDESVIESLFPGVDKQTVTAILGEPTFSDEELDVYGYKGKEIYVFFSRNEISIYRITDASADDFFDLTNKFIKEELDLLEFMNELTYVWPDYEKYEYSAKSFFISYPLKGIEIKLNYDDTSGILVYNNISSNLSKIKRYLENTNFVARLQKDAVYEAEKRRFSYYENLKEKYAEYQKTIEEEQLEIIGNNSKYSIYADTDESGNIYSIKFISNNGYNPNRELNDSVDYYLWIDNNTFLYSKRGKGIYVYNLNDGNVSRLIEGKEEYKLKGLKNKILSYDNTQVELQY